MVEKPDFHVVRLGLLGVMNEQSELDTLERVLRSVKHPTVKQHIAFTMARVRQRLKALGKRSEIKKFVNVAGGRKGDALLDEAVVHLRSAGYVARLVPAPFITATKAGPGGRRLPTLMPLDSGTAGEYASSLLRKAAIQVAQSGTDPDLNVPKEQVPFLKFTSHSLRRLTDGVVIEYCEKHGISKDRVDAKMGWKEAERKADMSHHYDENQLRRRISHCLSTSEM